MSHVGDPWDGFIEELWRDSVMKRGDPILRVEDLKMIRETLCMAQHALATVYPGETDRIGRIGRMIAEIDIQRPLGSDGKHGNRHTATCGCDI